MEFFTRLRPVLQSNGSILLLSGGDNDCARYSIAGWDPLAIFTCKGRECLLQLSDRQIHEKGDPLSMLQQLIEIIKKENKSRLTTHKPFTGGAIGYVAYELKNIIEKLPQQALADLDLPHMYWIFPAKIAVFDREEKSIRFFQWACPDKKGPAASLTDPFWRQSDFTPAKTSSTPNETTGDLPFRFGAISSNFSRQAYLETIDTICQYILKGDIYQANLTQRFEASFDGNPLSLFRLLFKKNPTPFYSYIHAQDHYILSTSMERFLWCDGHNLETRPIKGTRPRGKIKSEDVKLKKDLLISPKDDAELSMIVDLLRNDLGKVCVSGSVRVKEHKHLETYRYVHHLVSIVEGRLDPEKGIADILRATFPGGSITGCPKIRAMEIIDELEPHCRHVYTGSIGYIGADNRFDLNIAIRTLVIKNNRCYYGAGGGIVYDSDPEKEYDETLHKAAAFLRLEHT
jgi:para-aminobenzoate synthetase component 1